MDASLKGVGATFGNKAYVVPVITVYKISVQYLL